LNSKKILPFVLFLLVLVSSLVLGLSLDSNRLIAIAFVGATIGFFVTDLLKLFRIRGVLANVASVVILVLAMRDFLPRDSAGKLESVANLLVYLQTVLMFQEKTPRLNWQILILSLLQIVVAAIFSVHFEEGLLFLLYFFVVAVALLTQSFFATREDVSFGNRASAKLFKSSLGDSIRNTAYRQPAPLTFSDVDGGVSSLKTMRWHVAFWMIASLLFTAILFFNVPRNARPWFGPTNIQVDSSGLSREINLDERGIIDQPATLMFRVQVEDRDGELMDLASDPPYFRGMALSSIKVVDNVTTWVAPYDRVYRDHYQQMGYADRRTNIATQKIKMEETANPLLYGVMPFLKSEGSNDSIVFCHEVSAHTRCRAGEPIDLVSYAYEATTLLDKNNRFSKFWPYLSNRAGNRPDRPMSDDPLQKEWLTQMDHDRYPEIVRVAKRLAKEWRTEKGSRIELLKKMERYFLDRSRFKYTLDFRKVPRVEGLDPVEDFFANHQQGHCELYASALTLMLRSQGIPARYVVGFVGSDLTPISDKYLVKAKNAHAWVEAYLRPEDCDSEMFQYGLAGPGGAWMTLDSTPPTGGDSNVGEGAIDLVREVWDDLVLGEDGSQISADDSNYSILNFLSSGDFQLWERRAQEFQEYTNSGAFRFLVAGAIFFLFFGTWIKARFFSDGNVGLPSAGRLRRLFGKTLSLIAPKLGQWVIEGASAKTPTVFYQRMLRMLEPHELVRDPGQTHREFATEVAVHFDDHPKASEIQSNVDQLTQWFNRIRFGRQELDSKSSEEIDETLSKLQRVLKEKSDTTAAGS
jgi:hypothetical protein